LRVDSDVSKSVAATEFAYLNDPAFKDNDSEPFSAVAVKPPPKWYGAIRVVARVKRPGEQPGVSVLQLANVAD